ncbi:MAG: MOSC domain-containing protein [Sarcina sp.]
MGKIREICISEKKGTQKKAVGQALLVEEHGIEGDAHAGKWHRQVSLLSYEKVKAFNEKGANVGDGAFGENLIVEGIDLAKLPVGTILTINDEIMLEVTQIGKQCHHHCQIYHKVGDCIMPREGIFTRVIKGGYVKAGYEIEVLKISNNGIDKTVF